MASQPFTLAVPDDALADLHDRLARTRFPDQPGSDRARTQGAPLADVQRLVARWRDGYDWRQREADINKLPQFTTPVAVEGFGTLDIHFLYQRSEVTSAIPLLFVHGWPGHFLEVEKILPLLTAASPDHPSFHVVAPSLPGFGFSEAPTKSGFSLSRHAEVCDKLMLSLGYRQYVTQGGDWGNHITRIMAIKYGGASVRAAHTNMPLGVPMFPLNALAFFRGTTRRFLSEESAYFLQQATRPQTLAYALADSPAGLLAWIYEKLYEWTDAYPWTDDEVLDWVSIYWFARAGPAAAGRIYYDFQKAGLWEQLMQIRPVFGIPYGVSLFPKEVIQPPLFVIRALHNLVSVGEHAHGGHFSAYEQPLELAGDLREMFGRGGPAFGVVHGGTGY